MRQVLSAVVVLSWALAGCSGSGGTANVVSPPTTAPAPTPTPTPAPDPHPLVDGAVVTFVVDDSSVDVQPGSAPTMSADSGTVTETIHTGATFNGHPAIDVHTASADGNFIEDNYEGYVPSPSGQNFVWFGQTYSYVKEQISNSFNFPDVRIFDEIPEVTGASWNNPISQMHTKSQGPANQHVDETATRHNDGSEIRVFTHTDGIAADTYTNTYTINADGTGSLLQKTQTGGDQFSFGVPVQQGGAFVIPVTYTDKNGTKSYTVPDWYPGHALPVPPFITDSNTDLGVQMPPAACSKGPQIPAAHIRETTNSMDLFGNISVITQDGYYAPSRGLICYTSTETDTTYDYTDSGALLDTFTTSTVYALTSGIGAVSDRRRPSSVTPAYPFLPHRPRMTRDNPPPPRAPAHR